MKSTKENIVPSAIEQKGPFYLKYFALCIYAPVLKYFKIKREMYPISAFLFGRPIEINEALFVIPNFFSLS